jgi:PDZ domain-containing protein
MPRAKRFLTGFVVALGIGVAFLIGWMPLPYYSLGPGPAREVQPLIHVSGHKEFPSQGKLIMTTVRFHAVTALGALVAWLDPHQSLVSQDVLYPPGVTAGQETQRALSQMDQSKIDAAYVVLSRLANYPKSHGDGALIEGIFAGCPAEGKLFAGDTLESIDGVAVHTQQQAGKALDAAPLDDPITLQVRAAGEAHAITLTRRRCAGSNHPVLGVSLIDRFPFDVRISSGDVGGPSAGLMWALGLYDLLTPGDLTGGRTIAGTGEISVDGTVGPIGGIKDKIVAAERAGAAVFLVPSENMAELEGFDTAGMKLVSVATFQGALDALVSLGGQGIQSGSTGATGATGT